MKFALAGALALVSCLLAPMALAADSTSVSIPVGDWLQQGSAILAGLAASRVLWLIARLPPAWSAAAKAAALDQLLTKAIDYGINAVAGAEKGKTLSVNVGNAVLATALQYAVTHGPEWLLAWAGGKSLVAQKLVARLPLEGAASVVHADVPQIVAGPQPAAGA